MPNRWMWCCCSRRDDLVDAKMGWSSGSEEPKSEWMRRSSKRWHWRIEDQQSWTGSVEGMKRRWKRRHSARDRVVPSVTLPVAVESPRQGMLEDVTRRRVRCRKQRPRDGRDGRCVLKHAAACYLR